MMLWITWKFKIFLMNAIWFLTSRLFDMAATITWPTRPNQISYAAFIILSTQWCMATRRNGRYLTKTAAEYIAFAVCVLVTKFMAFWDWQRIPATFMIIIICYTACLSVICVIIRCSQLHLKKQFSSLNLSQCNRFWIHNRSFNIMNHLTDRLCCFWLSACCECTCC